MRPLSLQRYYAVSGAFRTFESFGLKLIAVTICLWLWCFTASSQSTPEEALVNKMMPKPVPASPNVAALGKYGDYQVSHFTGVPEISIPIFEVQSGSLKVPITLSYHASGVKQTDVASWVGLGWSLSTGGQISRSVSGKADEVHYSTHALEENASVCDLPGSPGTFHYMQMIADGVDDADPDVFSYSCPGGSGKFMMTYGGPFLIPYAPIIINASTGFGSFQITDENGILYQFGSGTQDQEVTTAYYGGTMSYTAATAWHMTNMSAPNSNDEISYAFQDIGTFNTHDISYSYTLMDECDAQNTDPNNPPGPGTPGACPPNSFISVPHNNNSDGMQKGPSEITFETGKVKFILSSTGRSDYSSLKHLEKIEVRGINNELLKTIQFVYSYFTDMNGTNAALKLDAVQFKDNLGAIVQVYNFEYFSNSFSWDFGNDNYLNARDLWGQYNGALTNTDLLLPKTVPFQQTSVSTVEYKTFGGGTNRAVNTAYIKEGVLKKITFPTGGYTEFDFEANKYLDNVTPTLAGGLRVTKITSTADSSAPPVLKTYKYGEGESGYGIANFKEYQFNYNSSQMVYGGCEINYPSVFYKIRSYSSNTAFNTDMFDSSPVLYPVVTEYFGDPTSTTNGKIIYTYDNGTPSGSVDWVVPSSGKYYRNSFGWKRGKLTNKTVYDNANHKLSETTIGYTELKGEERFIGLGVHAYIGGVTGCAPLTCENEAEETVATQHFFFREFFQNSGAYLQTSVTETTFENGNVNRFLTTSSTSSYDPDKIQVVSSVTSRSNTTEQSVTINRYPFEFSVPSASTGAAKGIYKLNEKNILTTPIETYTYLQNSDNTNQRVVSAQVTSYRQSQANAAHAVADRIYLWESDVPIAKSSYTPITVNGGNSGIVTDARLVPRIDMVTYDIDGNLLTASKINNGSVSYKYGYNKAFPVAEVVNAADNEFFYESFEESTESGVANDPVTAHSGNKYFSGDYTVNFTPPNARSYRIEYWYRDTDNTWKYISKPFTGAVLNEGSAIDNIRLYPVDAQIKTYTYNPSIGLTSSLSEGGLLMRYDYDSFGRLWRIRNEKGNIEKQYDYHYKGQ